MVVIGAGHSGARDRGAQVHYHHSGVPQVMYETLSGLVLLPPMLHTCDTARAIRTGSGQYVYVRGILLAILTSQCTSISGSKCD